MKKLDVRNRVELEKLWGEHLDNPDVKSAVDAQMDTEKRWLDLVAETDRRLAIEEDKLTTNVPASVGTQLNTDVNVIDGSSGSVLSLDTICKESPHTLFVYLRHYG